MLTVEFLKVCPNTPTTRKMGECERAPLSNREIRGGVGYKNVHDWKKYYNLEKEVAIGRSKEQATQDGGVPI